MSGRAATGLGVGAILLWSTLASLTVLSGGLPPFQTTAVAFAIGATVIGLAAIARGRAGAMLPTPASLALGVYGLFGYHALYFLALKSAPAVEANLINYLWPLLIVLFSALLPGERLRWFHVAGAALGLAGAAILTLGGGTLALSWDYALGYGAAAGCALVWSSYSVASRLLASVPSESLAVSCLATSVLACFCSLAFETWVAPSGPAAWTALACLGLGPVGAAFLLWDIGMKQGDTSLLGVLAYASPILSTLLLVALDLAEPTWALAVACVLMVVAAVIATRGA